MNKNKKRMHEIVNRLIKAYPDSKISLNFSNPYELLVATILSAQSTDKRVNMVLPNLFNAFPDVQSLSKAEIKDIIPYIKTLGWYNNKAKSLHKMAKMVASEFSGKIPSTMNELIKLPGVGRKTANVVLGNGFGIKNSGITVDTHVTRICNRLGVVHTTNAIIIERELIKLVPEDKWVEFTHLMIDHGRKICVRKPKCDICVLEDLCDKNLDYNKKK